MEVWHSNVLFAWAWFAVGVIAGAVQGLYFHGEQWLGGYGSWPRRLTRLGHVAFFGTGLLNLAFAGSLAVSPPVVSPWLAGAASVTLIAGAVAMPAVCYLSAWRKPLRAFFPVPVTLLAIGVAATLLSLIVSHLNRGVP